jgi:hypothetical protein
MLQQSRRHAESANPPPSCRRHLNHTRLTHEDELSLALVIIPGIVGHPYSALLGLILQQVVIAVEGVDEPTATTDHGDQIGPS